MHLLFSTVIGGGVVVINWIVAVVVAVPGFTSLAAGGAPAAGGALGAAGAPGAGVAGPGAAAGPGAGVAPVASSTTEKAA